MQPARFSSLALLLLVAAASCFNPVHSDAVASLGGEVNGVRTGPLHRPGQPCLTCHGGAGPASPQFVFAGTVFTHRNTTVAADGVTVSLQDANGDTRTLSTNRAGNFYMTYDSWSPTYPVKVVLSSPDFVNPPPQRMYSTIGRNGACAFCHYDDPNNPNPPDHMPHLYMSNP